MRQEKFLSGIDVSNVPILNVPSPTVNTHAANKQYVDDQVKGVKPKEAVRYATTANITLAGNQVIDGGSTGVGTRILVWKQTDAAENGIYLRATGAWTRATDFDEISPIDEVNRAYVVVQEGTANAGKVFIQTGTVTTIGTDDINFVFYNTLSVDGTTIVDNAGALSINKNRVAVILEFDSIGGLSYEAFAHNLNNRNVVVSIRNKTSHKHEIMETTCNLNSVSIDFGADPGTNYAITISGLDKSV